MKKTFIRLAVASMLILLLLKGCDMLEIIDQDVCISDTAITTIREPMIITAQQAEEMMGQDGVLILDVRTPDEFNSGHIENAILLPYSDLFESARSIITDKNTIILIYCRSGMRSNVAAWLLYELGFTRVYDFGGIIDWHGAVVTQ